MKVGLFFGSFNPVHIGHMALANYLLEFTNLERIWFVVSPHNPLKEKKTLLADHHRLELVRLAIGEHPKMKASNIEFKLPQPSYTVDTLAYLEAQYPSYQFVLLMGEDNLPTLPKWKNYQVLLERYPIYVYPRPGTPRSPLHEHPSVRLLDTPLLEISATFIRQCVKEGRSIRYMVPEAVEEYIRRHEFWR